MDWFDMLPGGLAINQDSLEHQCLDLFSPDFEHMRLFPNDLSSTDLSPDAWWLDWGASMEYPSSV